ncbi:MAG: cadherin-like domain-containing protein, partial [Bacteroidota bacterium]
MRTILVQPQRTTFPFFSHLLATVLLLFQGAAFGQETITLTADPSYLTGDGSGLQNWEDGVTLQAINLDGTPGRVAFETRFSDDGFGVAGARWDQIDFYEEAGNRSEQLIIDFGGPVTNVTLTTGMLGAGEGPGNENDDETGLWRAFDGEGAQVAEGLIGPELSDLGPNVKYEGTYGKYPIRLPSERPFHSVVIEATGFGHGLGRSEQRRYGENNSDFNIMEVSYVRASAGSDNRPPVAMDDDFFEIREDIGLTGIQYSTLLDNDSDPDGDSFLITGFDFTGFPGTIEDFPGDQEILFTTAENFSGLIQFTYTISDGNATSTATISINVINLLDDPVVVQDGPFSTLVNEALTLPVAELLANDFDPDGEEIAFQSVGEAVNGTVEVQADVVLFTPDSDFVGKASF